MDLGALFGDAKTAVTQGMSDLLHQGGNAALGYLEQQAVSVIQTDQAQHTKNFQDATMEMMKRPSGPDSFGAYISNALQSPVLKNYGPYMMIGVAVVAVGAIVLFGRK